MTRQRTKTASEPDHKHKQTQTQTQTQTHKQKASLRVIPLGGLDGIGKNMTVIEYGDDMLVVDAGIMFPDDDQPGVDLILPDYSYIVKRKQRLRGIIITHGHEDHTGALPFLLKDLDGMAVPILGTKLTLGLITGKLAEHKIKRQKLREIKGGGHVSLGPFGLDFFAVNHSIPDGVGVFIRTPGGNVLHTGDFKLDQTPLDGRLVDYPALSRFAKAGVTVLMSDSTGAESPGVTLSESEVGPALRSIVASAKQKVVVASFASHIHRVQQVCDAAVGAGRKVVVTGRSMVTNTGVARELGYLSIDKEDIVDAFDARGMAPESMVIMCTGSQGEPLSALARMANGEHRTVQIERGDTVIFAATPVPGNEKAVTRVINRLIKAGADVRHKGTDLVHVSGHASRSELQLMLNMTKPTYFVPIHGEIRHLAAHKRIAMEVGIPEQNIFLLDNGDCLEISETDAQITGQVESGVVYVDGTSVGDVGQVILRDRQHLAEGGVVTVVLMLETRTGRLQGEAQVVMTGVAADADATGLDSAVRASIKATLSRTSKEGATDQHVVGKAVRSALSQLFWERLRRRPMIIPVVMEV